MYLASCDRDEKIRISRFSEPYVIQSFCLGHKSYVECVGLTFKNKQQVRFSAWIYSRHSIFNLNRRSKLEGSLLLIDLILHFHYYSFFKGLGLVVVAHLLSQNLLSCGYFCRFTNQDSS